VSTHIYSYIRLCRKLTQNNRITNQSNEEIKFSLEEKRRMTFDCFAQTTRFSDNFDDGLETWNVSKRRQVSVKQRDCRALLIHHRKGHEELIIVNQRAFQPVVFFILTIFVLFCKQITNEY
jgi:hypothetical protein